MYIPQTNTFTEQFTHKNKFGKWLLYYFHCYFEAFKIYAELIPTIQNVMSIDWSIIRQKVRIRLNKLF